MKYTFCPPQTPAQKLRDELLGALIALARATTNEPKTEDTDQVLGAGLRLVSRPDAGEAALQKMLDIARTEKHRVAPNCATCAMPCGNTNEYDLQRLWTAPETIRALKLRLLSAVCELAHKRPDATVQKGIDDGLFILAEDWDTDWLLPAVERTEKLCAE